MNTAATVEHYYHLLGFDEIYAAFLPTLKQKAEAHDLDCLSPDELKEQEDPVLNLAWFLYRCEELEKQYADAGIPHTVFLDTASDIRIWTDTHMDFTGGTFGLTENDWLLHHMQFRLFRLGRLQFAFGENTVDCPAKGLSPKEKMIEVHIPKGDALTEEACLSSFHQAESFFRTYFPAYTYRFYTCHSWLLDANLTKLLKSTSNILRFAALFDVVESEESDAALRYIFKWNDRRETVLAKSCPPGTLQSRLKDYLASGGTLQESYGILPRTRVQ